jgi:hypothetical protein
MSNEKSYSNFTYIIKQTPGELNCQNNKGVFELHSGNVDKFMNVVLAKDASQGHSVSLCLVPADAKAIRDALIEAYPVASTMNHKRPRFSC